MRIRKNKQPGMPPEQVEALGRLSPDDWKSIFSPDSVATDILRQLDQAQKRRLEVEDVWGGPRLRGGTARRDAPPPANRGGKSPDGSEYVKLVVEDGVVKQVLKRRGYGDSSAFVDWINFTIGEETIDEQFDQEAQRYGFRNGVVTETHEGEEGRCQLDSGKVMMWMSEKLERILGYGISHKLSYGQHFYAETFQMAEGWGTVSYGGQARTILVSISGKGLAAARFGWEARLQKFLEGAERARITRADLAHDFYNDHVHGPALPFRNVGYSVDRADQEHSDGLFNCGGRNPDCEHRGNWKSPNGKGRTLTIGNRKNGKFCRIYEKGREQGDKNSHWVRVEVELKSVDRIIPFDVLTRAGEYLATQYPALSWISEHQERIFTTQKETEISVSRAVQVLKHQFGCYIHHLADLFGSAELVEMVRRDDRLPAFAKIPHYGLAEPSMHHDLIPPNPVSLHAAASAW